MNASFKQEDHTNDPVSTQNPKSSRRTRGLDEIAPFLHQVNKIVSEECAKHETVDHIPWYNTWDSWMQQNLLRKTSMNSITSIIVPDLFYNERTIKAIVERCIDEIHPITSYIDITHLTDKSVKWVPRVDIASFKSVRNKRSRNPKTPKITIRNLAKMKITHVIRVSHHLAHHLPPLLLCLQRFKSKLPAH